MENTNDNKPKTPQKKEEPKVAEAKTTDAPAKQPETPKIVDKKDTSTTSPDKAKKETKKQKAEEKPVEKKEKAVVHGRNIHISKKQGMYICSFIKNKSIDSAIQDLEKVILFKKIVPFKGEIPHRKGKGIMSGRYPVKASKLFITLLRGLRGNVLVNNMELDKSRISEASTSWASRPLRKGNVQAKRVHVTLTAKEAKK
tara:strand:+ start:9614 stop:10210 length:597 start_codon:yes stop_codon:yes gene_type:complete